MAWDGMGLGWVKMGTEGMGWIVMGLDRIGWDRSGWVARWISSRSARRAQIVYVYTITYGSEG